MRRLALLVALTAVAGVAIARRRRLRTGELASPSAPPAGLAPAPAAGTSGERFVSVAWTLAAPPDDRPQLAIACHQDDQLALDRVDVQETPTQVFLTAIARREPRAASEPPRTQAQATVALSRPLGERELIPTPVDPYP